MTGYSYGGNAQGSHSGVRSEDHGYSRNATEESEGQMLMSEIQNRINQLRAEKENLQYDNMRIEHLMHDGDQNPHKSFQNNKDLITTNDTTSSRGRAPLPKKKEPLQPKSDLKSTSNSIYDQIPKSARKLQQQPQPRIDDYKAASASKVIGRKRSKSPQQQQ